MSVPPNGDAGSSISSSQLFLQFVNFFQTVLLTSLRRRKNFHKGAILFLKGRRSDATVVLKNWQTVFFDDKIDALARKSLWQRLSGAGYWKTCRAITKWAQSIQKPVFATIQYFILLSLSLSLSRLLFFVQSNASSLFIKFSEIWKRRYFIIGMARFDFDDQDVGKKSNVGSNSSTCCNNNNSSAATTAEAATTAHTTTPYETAKAITTAVEAAAIDSNNQQVFLKAIIFYLTIRWGKLRALCLWHLWWHFYQIFALVLLWIGFMHSW